MRDVTLRDLLQRASEREGARISFADDDAVRTLDVAQLVGESEQLAGVVAPAASAGDLVVIALGDPREFLPVFWACQLRGLVPVPLAPPAFDVAPFARACEAWGRPPLVTDAEVLERAPEDLVGVAQDGRALHGSGNRVAPRPTLPNDDDALALVQPSSGTTGRPRGVRLSHRNLVENVRQITDRLALGPGDTVLSWMPLFHDMGLIATHVASLAAGAHQVWMTPAAFFRRPERWLELATTTRATILTGTNTSLRLLGRRLDDDALTQADLSSVRRFLVGAEPIAPRVLLGVEQRLARARLPAGALGGSYGLAEASVGVALEGTPRPARVHRAAREVLATVGAALRAADDDGSAVEVLEIGRPLDGVELRIADESGAALPAWHVGHVEVRGPNVTPGYLFDDDATEGARRPDGFWRTGDLGFVSPDGALSVCGRVKELLFAGGRNLYAEDVEAIAGEVEGVKRAVATWATADDGDPVQGLFLVVEPSAEAPAVVVRTREHVARRTGLALDVVEVIEPRDIPRTTSGKVQRGRLGARLLTALQRGAPTTSGHHASVAPSTREEWEALVRRTWADVLSRALDDVPLDVSFASLGGSSVTALEVQGRLEAALGVPLDHEVLLSAPTVSALAARLSSPTRAPRPRPARRRETGADDPIAVVGMACRLPLGDSPDALWRALLEGKSAVRAAPTDRWRRGDADDLPHVQGSWLDDPWAFDGAWFGIAAEEARRIDPQQRLFLEVALEGLERAGFGCHRRAGLTVGVFAGASSQPYLEASLAPWQRRAAFERLLASDELRALPDEHRRALERAAVEVAGERTPHAATLAGNLLNLIAGRAAHALGLTGPALVVDTACSSSLVAVHLACESLRRGECDVALAGGVALHLTPHVHRAFHAAGALSRAGACRPFSDGADGIVPGEGAAAVVLEPLSRAREAGREVLAIVRGSAVNNDGRSLGIMAPNPEGQRAVLREAYRRAGISPERVSLVEAHGTGTLIGDPVELRALTGALGSARERALGSVKANLGHLMAAAGITGLVKVVLALQQRTLPPSLDAGRVNPRLELSSRRLRLVVDAEPWDEPSPRVAGVSAFGFGGTNCHVVIEEAPSRAPPSSRTAGPALLLLSAPTLEHLAKHAAVVAAHVEEQPSELPAVASALHGRTHHRFRAAAAVDDLAELGALVETITPATVRPCSGEPLRVALLFPGQGSQHVRQARGLLARWPSLRARALELLDGVGARAAFDACWTHHDEDALRRTDVAQPLLFAFQVSLAEALGRIGVRPRAVLGHSVGEIAALACAGVLDVEAALRWVHERGRVMQGALPPGAMAAALAPEDVVAPLLARAPDQVGVAAVNGPRQTVIAGRPDEVRRVCLALEERGVVTRPLPVAHAFHSPLVEQLLPELRASLPRLQVADAAVEVVSTVLAAPLSSERVDHEYLVGHARHTVRFADAMRVLIAGDIDAFVEVGPGNTLARLTHALLDRADTRPTVSLCRAAPQEGAPPHDDGLDVRVAYDALASLYVRGVDVDPGALESVAPSARVPVIPWRRERLRLDEEPETTPSRPGDALGDSDAVPLQRRIWTPFAPSSSEALPSGAVRLVAPPGAFRDAMVEALAADGRAALVVEPRGAGFGRVAEDRFLVDPYSAAAVRWLLEASVARSSLWLVDDELPLHDVLLRLSAWHGATSALPTSGPLLLVSRARPALSSALRAGAAALRAEGMDVSALTLDASAPLSSAALAGAHAVTSRTRDVRVLASGEAVVATLRDAMQPGRPLSWKGKAFVILGGSGGVGGALARLLARRGAARLVLVARSETAASAALLETVRGLGAAASVVCGDLRDDGVVERALATAVDGGAPLGGVVHAVGAAHLGSLASRAPCEIDDVVGAKVRAADALARALEGQPCDFVALVSSVTTADPRQARGLVDYAAANAYLEGLAGEQRARGQPWVALAFPAWRGAGLATSLATTGAELDEERATQAFERALSVALSYEEATLVLGRDASRPEEDVRPHIDTFETITTESADALPEPPAVTPEEDDLEAFLRGAVARAIRRPPADVDVHASLVRLGLDSLAAVDIVKQLEERVGRKLSLTLLFEHDTIAKVVSHLGAKPLSEGLDGPPAPSPRGAALDGAPLLPAQQTFFANHGLLPHLPGYVFVGVDLDGPLSPQGLERALSAVWARHPVLRAGFEWQEGQPVHRAREGAPPALVQHNLRALPPLEQDERALAIEHELRNQLFDLERPPLARVVLLRRGERRWSLLLTLHHIVADAWSAHRLLDELLELHAREARGDLSPLPPLRTTFADVARALAEPSPDADESRRFWESTLREPPEPLSLPFDGDPDAEPTGPCELHQVTLNAKELEELRATAREAGVSEFDTVLASYAHALRDWSGADDVIIRVANARREVRLPDIEHVVGCFADSLPVRLDAGTADLEELARRARAASLEAMRHPFTSSLSLAALAPRSRGGPRGLTPAGLSFPSFRAREQWGELRALGMRGGSASGFTQLALIAWKSSAGLTLAWSYTQPLFRPSTIERMANEHLEVLRRLAHGTKARVVRTSRRTPLPPGRVLHERVRNTAERAPERVAIVDGPRTLSHGALSERASRVASVLQERGESRGALVGVLARPGIEAVTGVLGALSAGAAYVPADPDYPDERVGRIFTHAGVRVALTTSDQLHRLLHQPPAALRAVVLLDDGVPKPPASPTNEVEVLPWREVLAASPRPPPASAPDDLAYVMYTSGTTGAPKGVMVTHEAVSHFHDWVHDAFEIVEDDRFLQTSALSFGGSIRQIFSSLLAGASLYPVPRELLRDPLALARFLEDRRITLWNSVPTLWRRLLEALEDLDREGTAPTLDALRWILIGGEEVPADLARRWRARFGGKHRVANLYGSTETIVNATSWELDRRVDDERHVPIGNPRAGSTVHVLDDDGRPTPGGDVGELYVGGPSLSSGYLHEPALSARAFVRLLDGSVAYRTGDLVRARPDGALVYAGRRDTLVKVRGNRVELGEIEGVLREDERVRQACVVEWRRDEQQRLVAFVEPSREGAPPDEGALRRKVAAALPDYMMPHRFVVLPRLPLTAAGKIDRRALRARLDDDSGRVDVQGASAAHDLRALEEVIAGAFARVLDVPGVPPDGDFFLLGGDSILALDAVRRLRGEGVEIPRPMLLYAERTPRALARALAALPASPPSNTIVSQRSTSDVDLLPLLPAQRGFLLAQAVAGGRPPLLGARVPLRGDVQLDAFRRAVERLSERHAALRTCFPLVGGSRRQRVERNLPLPLVVIATPSADGEDELRSLFSAGFDLERGPLVRLALLIRPHGPHTLVTAAHHAVLDAVSLAVLARDVVALYEAELQGAPPALPSLVSNAFDIVKANERSPSPQELDWWHHRFPTPPRPLMPTEELPQDVEPRRLTRRLAPATSRALDEAAEQTGHTAAELVFTAYARALARAAATHDVTIGTARSGRELPLEDAPHLVGCFAAGVPVRVDVDPNAPFRDDLERCAAALRAHLAHADVPQSALARVLPRDPSTGLPVGSQCFLSVIDLRRLSLAGPSGSLAIDLEEAETTFAAEASGSRAFLVAKLGREHRLTLHARLDSDLARRLLDDIARELQEAAASLGPRRLHGPRAQPSTSVDAAIVGYLPSAARLAALVGGDPAEVRARARALLFPSDAPIIVETTATEHGRSAAVVLPLFADELSHALPTLPARIAAAAALARHHGARALSLAGLLPSLTGYGLLVASLLERNGVDLRLTSGHAATACAVVATTLAALRASGRDLRDMHLGALGYGSIGQAALGLLVELAGPPRALTVLELPERLPALQRPFETLRHAVPAARLLASDRAALGAVDVLLCATSGGGLDVTALRPGTLVIDDSFPPAFDVDLAWPLVERGALFAVDAGRLDIGGELHAWIEDPTAASVLVRGLGPGMPGCRVESVLLSAHPDLPATLGLPALDDVRRWWARLAALGVGAAPFALHGRPLPGISLTLSKVST